MEVCPENGGGKGRGWYVSLTKNTCSKRSNLGKRRENLLLPFTSSLQSRFRAEESRATANVAEDVIRAKGQVQESP